MIERLPFLWPEVALFVATCVVMVLGLSPAFSIRRLCAPVCALALVIAGALGAYGPPMAHASPLPELLGFAKPMIAGVGLLLLLLQGGVVDRREEHELATGARPFDALRTNRAEFYSFFLFSITGLMLVASATDLIWLFLALELTSLPTYIMVAISGAGPKASTRSQEAGVKYFFLGALGAATFLYGFALLYGGTGHTSLAGIADVLASAPDGPSPIALIGLLLALAGIAFKIAAVPMHFYTPDVYQGAASPVTAFLAFVPKAAGFLAILLIVSCAGWRYGPSGASLPEAVRLTLWVMAALTMTVGNVLAILQTSIKRILAYSSVAHSGYMLVGVIAGPGDGSFSQSGISAVLFYLLCYGVMNVGAFGAVAALERSAPGDQGHPTEIDSIDDLKGLCATRPVLGWAFTLCVLSLLGMPPLLGFFAKLPLFTSAIAAGEIPLVVVLGLNSAIAAFYYLRLAGAAMLSDRDPLVAIPDASPFPTRRLAAIASAAGVIVLVIAGNRLMAHAERAGRAATPVAASGQPHATPAPESGAPSHAN